MATGSGLDLFWRYSLFTWSLTPDDSAAVNPRRVRSPSSALQVLRSAGLNHSLHLALASTILPTASASGPPDPQQGNLWLTWLASLPPTLKAPVNVWIPATSSAWSHRNLRATVSGLLPLYAPLLFLFCCDCHVLCGSVVQRGIFPGSKWKQTQRPLPVA